MGANLADLVRDAAAVRPDHQALVGGGGSLTWAQVDDAVDAAAGGLQALGLHRGDRVALVMGNVPEFVAAYFGMLRTNLVAVPANTASTASEIRWLLSDSGAGAVVFDRGGAAAVRVVAAEMPDLRRAVVCAPAPGETPFGSFSGAPRLADTEDEDLAVLLFTSGTSGRPKGAMLSHGALLASVEQVHALPHPAVTPDDVVLLVLPLSHVYALNGTLAAVARAAATAVLVERFDPVETLEVIRREQVTNVPGAPPMYVAWSAEPGLADAFALVRLLLTGAAPIPTAVVEQVRTATGLPVFEGYGLTETGPVLTTTLASPIPKGGSIGRPLPGVSIKLVAAGGEEIELTEDDFDDDAPGSPGTDPGEIVARGANLFSGYWPDGRDGPGADGWWPTGDVAYADGDGDLFLVDRLRELILVSGFNVYPYEVEQVLMAHPAVAEAAVLGVPHPYTGQTVKAFVVTSEPVATEELLAYCERNLARFKCPTAIEFVASMPHSATGKVRKAALRG